MGSMRTGAIVACGWAASLGGGKDGCTGMGVTGAGGGVGGVGGVGGCVAGVCGVGSNTTGAGS